MKSKKNVEGSNQKIEKNNNSGHLSNSGCEQSSGRIKKRGHLSGTNKNVPFEYKINPKQEKREEITIISYEI